MPPPWAAPSGPPGPPVPAGPPSLARPPGPPVPPLPPLSSAPAALAAARDVPLDDRRAVEARRAVVVHAGPLGNTADRSRRGGPSAAAGAAGGGTRSAGTGVPPIARDSAPHAAREERGISFLRGADRFPSAGDGAPPFPDK